MIFRSTLLAFSLLQLLLLEYVNFPMRYSEEGDSREEGLTGERWWEGCREESQTTPGSCSPLSACAPRQSSRDTRRGRDTLLPSLLTTVRGGGGDVVVVAAIGVPASLL